VLPSSIPAPPTTKRRKQSNPPKLITHPTQSLPSTPRENLGKNPPSRERKFSFACFVVVLVTWMSFAFGERELRRGALIMLETHIMISSLIFWLVLILMLCLSLLLMFCISSLMDLTIAHMVLVHMRTALCLDALDAAHVLIVVIVSHVCLVFLLEGIALTLSPNTWMVHIFPIMVHVPLSQMVRCKGL
jgi:uncharacterized protein YjeT (DUF2065 family)